MENQYKGRKAVVLGLGKSGVAAAKLLFACGAEITVNDQKDYNEVANEAECLRQQGIDVITGYHPEDLLDGGIDFIVKNPGIPYHIPLIEEATRRNIPIITEIELASQIVDGEFIGITGSNGKTTTTTLVGEMLKRAGQQAHVGGNIGTPLSDIVMQEQKTATGNSSAMKQPIVIDKPIVLELSSFQLQGTDRFRPQIAAILNVYPTHLDYHQTLEQYVRAKGMIFKNQRPGDTLLLNADQTHFESDYAQIQSEIIFCSRFQPKKFGFVVDNDEIVYRTEQRKVPICSVEDIRIPGKHNLENVLFAAAVATLKQVSSEVIRQTLMHFQGVEHRLELVGEFQGVKYYNDSKATNQQATSQALRAFSDKVILIAGGLDRGNDFDDLVGDLQTSVQAMIVYGQTAGKLADAGKKAGINDLHTVNNLEDAVEFARNLAKPRDIVLLSPACASWDMFSSFEERGRMFKQYILKAETDSFHIK